MSTGPGNQTLTPVGAFTQQAAASLLAGPIIPIAVSGAIPVQPGRYLITKAGVAALTLPAPVAGAQDGVLIEVTSSTAYAHTITTPNAGDIQDGNASGYDTVMTFNAHKGASCLLCAMGGVWYVQSEIGCALSS